MSQFNHLSVLPLEVIHYLAPKKGGLFVDGTVGGGGHSSLILEKIAPDGILVAIDQDIEAIEAASAKLATYGSLVKFVHSNFENIDIELDKLGISEIDGFLLDLGVSSHQLDSEERGFSFRYDAALDMRMDRSRGESAADLLNRLSEEKLSYIIKNFGEERFAKKIARKIVEKRGESPILTTLQLADIVRSAIPKSVSRTEKIDPATRTFQALRIAVNRELEVAQTAIEKLFKRLKTGGRGVVISFHSLEDRIVKTLFKDFSSGCRCPKDFPICVCNLKPVGKILTSKPVEATEDEIAANPRSRSAKLRAIEKL